MWRPQGAGLLDKLYLTSLSNCRSCLCPKSRSPFHHEQEGESDSRKPALAKGQGIWKRAVELLAKELRETLEGIWPLPRQSWASLGLSHASRCPCNLSRLASSHSTAEVTWLH